VNAAKRSIDIFVSMVGLTILAPAFLVIAALIWLEERGPIFYRGKRVGRAGVLFRIFKFRTMVADAEQRGGSSTTQDDVRVTRLGRVLRASKLDELPQLFNVLTGTMSLVGPRPQVEWAVALYTSEQRALLDVPPGITDLASIVFANEAELLRGSPDPDTDYLEKIAHEKIRLGLEYVRNRSVLLDLRIILATLCRVLGLPWQGLVNIPYPEKRDDQRLRAGA
jgi:lipopolysaccharide/colanic/teichoic acid biosynthesis glycosyltransferase